MHFTLVLKMANTVFYTRFLGKMYSLHFTLDLDPNYAFYTNAKNILYTVVESKVYFTLVQMAYFPLVKLRVVIYTNHLNFLHCIGRGARKNKISLLQSSINPAALYIPSIVFWSPPPSVVLDVEPETIK